MGKVKLSQKKKVNIFKIIQKPAQTRERQTRRKLFGN